MAKGKTVQIFSKITLGLLITLGILSIGAVIALQSLTLVSLWIPMSASFILALACAIGMTRFWKWIISSQKEWINLTCAVIIVTSIISGALYTLNFALADETTSMETPVLVERKFYKVRHHSKRVSRRVYTQGEAYKVYYLEIKFENGDTKEITVTHKEYRLVKENTTLNLSVARGLLGMPVIKRKGSIVDVPQYKRPTFDYPGKSPNRHR